MILAVTFLQINWSMKHIKIKILGLKSISFPEAVLIQIHLDSLENGILQFGQGDSDIL